MRKKVVAMGLAAMMAMSLAACSSGGSSTSTTAAGSSAEATTAAAAASSEESKKEEAKGDGKGYVVALCNYSIGNSWRAQMEQEFVSEAEKLKSEGVVSEYYITNSNEDINKQISDMQDLITKKVDAIVITTASPTALAPVVEEATEAGIKVVSFDNVVDTDEQVATVGIDETEFGRIGAEWLAEKLDGKGKIIVLNGIVGAATDSLRWGGAEEVFKNYPDIEVLGSANASWDYAQGKAAVESMLSAYPEIDGVWSQGGAMTQGAIDAFIAAGRDLVPMTSEGRVYLENQETQKLICHQAEHDALTEALNRGSYEKLLHIYETGDALFALILIDVDIFKSVNDIYGHAVGDAILQKVTGSLKKAFRSIDYVCRIGGDEFAVIMVDVTSDLKYTIEDKLKYVGEELAKTEGEVPAVTLSVGVAFSDRENPGESIFKDADKALYHVKENGRNGCAFYNGASSLENAMENHEMKDHGMEN